MSLLMDWRKNSSSSTIAINGAFDNRPSGARAKSPQHGRFKRCRASNAKSIGDEESRRGKPGAAKLWFMPFGRRRVYFCNGMCLTPMSSHLRIRNQAAFRSFLAGEAMPESDPLVSVIDDDPALRESVARLLRSVGVEAR